MKGTLAILIPVTLIVIACAPTRDSSGSAIQATAIPVIVTETQIDNPAPQATAQGGASATAEPSVILPTPIPATADSSGTESTGSSLPVNGITLVDNGKTFIMHTGESFLLNLGMDVYDWTVEVDNQNVIHRELNVMPIRGAQGIYIAQNLGTAVLTASGNPLCLQSRPPCMMPSLLFRITVIVE